jgi:hypothetical protein
MIEIGKGGLKRNAEIFIRIWKFGKFFFVELSQAKRVG